MEQLPAPTHKIEFKGNTILLFPLPNGDFIDAKGTIYPALLFDPGFCGLSPLETGKGDPWWKRTCQPHDHAFNNMKVGFQDSATDNLKTFGKFTEDIATGMLQGAYLLVSGPAYWLVGGVGGALKWAIDTKGKCDD